MGMLHKGLGGHAELPHQMRMVQRLVAQRRLSLVRMAKRLGMLVL
jgi:hypothetical protein